VLELVGTTTLKDSLRCAKQRGIVCMTGIVGNKWSFDNFAPMEAIPTAVSLTTYAGEAEDFMRTPLAKLVEQIAAGSLHVQVGKIFRLDEIVEAHRCMEENKAGGKIVVLTWPRLGRFALAPLRKKLVGSRLSLLATLLFDLLVDPPLVPERIDDLPVASSPEHVLDGHADARASRHRALYDPVRVVYQNGDSHARSAERFRRLAGSTFARGELVTDEEFVSVQSQFAVYQLLGAGLDHAVHLLGAKHPLVEVERRQPVAHNQFRDKLVFSIHVSLVSPSSGYH
jgi:hypothetical protein